MRKLLRSFGLAVVVFVFCFTSMLIVGNSKRVQAATKAVSSQSTKTIKSGKTYAIRQINYKIKYGNTVIWDVKYQYPQLKGKSTNVKSFNKSMKNMVKQDIEREVETVEKVESNILNDGIEYYTGGGSEFFYTNDCKLTYKKGNTFSFYMSSSYYAGGVVSDMISGINYDKKSGKYLQLADVVADSANVRKNIETKYVETYYGLSLPQDFNEKSSNAFYMKGNYARVCAAVDLHYYDDIKLKLSKTYQKKG